MDAERLEWCLKQKKGIRLIEPNINLAKDYIDSAEETLLFLQNSQGKSKIWLATLKYYAEYFAIYALLMRVRIKSEIHDCTIETCHFLEEHNLIPKGLAKTLEKDMELRVDNQYYLKNRKVKIDYEKLRDSILLVKNKINSITFDEIMKIRKFLRKFRK